MANSVVEAFSLSHAQILDGSSTFKEAAALLATPEGLDIYGVNEASLDPDTDDYDNEGDDTVLSKWSWLNNAGLEVQAGYLSFPLISSLTGRPMSSGGTGNAQIFETDLWHEDDFNIPAKPALLRMPSKDKTGAVRSLIIGLYRVQFGPITFDGPAYKDGLKVNYNGTALFSPVDEKGQAFADGKKRVGRLISMQ